MDAKKVIYLLLKLKMCVINESMGFNDNYGILMNDVDLDDINKILAENGNIDPKWIESVLNIDYMVENELKDKGLNTIDELKSYFERRYFKLSDSEAKYIFDKM